jgi:uncharacterized protein (TIGR00725 family)
VVICGGGTGVMAAVARGARSAGGVVVGIRPGAERGEDASPDLTATVVTNLGEARNAVIVWSADVVVAVGGSWGTLSEIALARRRGGVPVVILDGWQVLDGEGTPLGGFLHATTAEEAASLALRAGEALTEEPR